MTYSPYAPVLTDRRPPGRSCSPPATWPRCCGWACGRSAAWMPPASCQHLSASAAPSAGDSTRSAPGLMPGRPTAMPELLREASGLTADQLRFLREQARKLKERGTPGRAEGGKAASGAFIGEVNSFCATVNQLGLQSQFDRLARFDHLR